MPNNTRRMSSSGQQGQKGAKKQQVLLTSFLATTSTTTNNDDDNLLTSTSLLSNINKKKRPLCPTNSRRRSHDGSSFGNCPVCSVSYPLHKLETHAATCNGSSGSGSGASGNKMNKKARNNNDRAPITDIRNDATTTTTTPTDRNSNNSIIMKQHASFTEPIPGLFLFEDFITPEEEEYIIQQLDNTKLDDNNNKSYDDVYIPWKKSTFNGTHLGKRWGVHCNLRDRKVNAAEHPMPNFYNAIVLPKLKELDRKVMKGCIPNEGNAIDYRRKHGHYLKSHVDDRQLSKEPIANLSLAGDCYMTFRNVKVPSSVQSKKVLLKRRTLQILTGKARYDYSHGIDNADLLSDRRISVTMRESPLTTTTTTTTTKLLAVPAAAKSIEPVTNANEKPWWLQKKKAFLPQDSTSLKNEIKPTCMPIPGLFVFEDFITETEEAEILRELDNDSEALIPTSTQQPWKFEHHTGSHKEKRYGVDHDLWSQEVRPPKHEMPKFFDRLLLPKLQCVAVMMGCTPNDANAISYYRKIGHSLKSHVDDRKKHKEPIANLSLAGDCYMAFRNEQKHRPNLAGPVKKVLLKRRCLQVLTGKARYDYSHGIDNADLLSDRRVSFTMRETITP